MIALFRFIALALALIAGPAAAQSPGDVARYPERTIRIIVPFPAGGPTDILARVIGQRLAEDWGQPVVIENRPGGDTVIAAQQVAKAAPDGYTLLAAMDTTLVMNPATKKNLPYDPHKDFAFITMASQNTSLLSVRADVQPLAVAAGLPGFADISSWTGLVAPAGTPRQIVDKIQREVAKMYADPAIFKKLEGSGITAVSSTPEEFEAYFRKELVRWDTAFRESGIRLD